MNKFGWTIIVIAVIWAAVILASSNVLGATAYAPKIARILGGGAAATIILLGGSLRFAGRKWRGK